MTGKAMSICLKRVLVIVLAVVMMITFIPVFGNQAHAASSITRAPVNYPSMYETYSKYLFISTGANFYGDTRICMDIRPAGGKWKTYTGMLYYQTYQINGLVPNKVYQTRLYYKSIYTGEIGPYSKIVSFKTGPAKGPAIKSVKVKAVKVRKHKVRYYWYGVYIGSRKYYTFKIKTTVKLKKAPGTPYIYINGKRFKGNKKKYTVTTGTLVRWYSKPKGMKWNVTVYSGLNSIWKGYSPLYQKYKKVK